jgi:hypothetical protein
MSIILQPAGNKDGREHYLDTVQKSISIESVKSFLSVNEIQILSQIYPQGEFKCWGVTPSKINVGKWQRMRIGDVTLFSKTGGVFAKATTALKFHNKELAKHLWKTNSKGETWEYLYFVDEVRYCNIPYSQLNPILGYKPNYIIQGFNIIEGDKAEAALDKLGFLSETYLPEVSLEAAKEASLELSKTEKEVSSFIRLEQGWLRSQLFGNNTFYKCACCKRVLNVDMIVTAHIKPRKHCSHSERIDKKVVFPLCKFGCDELFEKRFLIVEGGRFVFNEHRHIAEDVKEVVTALEGEICEYYDHKTKEYFEFHRLQ